MRPYTDSEIPAAMRRIVAAEAFPLIASWVYPGRPIDEVKAMMLGFKTIDDFQLNVMRAVNEQVIARSITELSGEGFERLDPAGAYLFVSNHRDIMLDACLFNYLLWRNGHRTSQITFGSNLMSPGLVTDIGKSNKMFKVERGGKMRDLYLSSLQLSRYLRHVVTERGESVWIAQRNGRTKDGIDRTDAGLINMFAMSLPGDKLAALAELRIVPMTVSYEWESCDILKAMELYESRNERYVKKPGEDLNSIITGLLQPKGRVHIALGEEITRDHLEAFAGCTRAEYHKQVAHLLDERIVANYRLYPNNYIAHDLLYGETRFADRYTPAQAEAFKARLALLADYDVAHPELLNEIFLGIYANPCLNVRCKL